MNVVDAFPDGVIESLAQVMGDCGTGSEIDRVLDSCGLKDHSGESTKWRRLNWVFHESQRQYKYANGVLGFVKALIEPVRFVHRREESETHREKLNVTLAFVGLEYGADGEFKKRRQVRTLTEAEARANTIQATFKGRRIHPEVLKYCRSELMHDDSFHAILEATKGLAERIREMSGIEGDGALLVDRTFSIKNPVLAFYTLQTETEKSEHIGFATLLKGCFAVFRNPRAHRPRILWKDEDDTVDYFTLISLLHRKLDNCVPTGV